eukprot:5875323-Pyramimonas_sp.AAC.1
MSVLARSDRPDGPWTAREPSDRLARAPGSPRRAPVEPQDGLNKKVGPENTRRPKKTPRRPKGAPTNPDVAPADPQQAFGPRGGTRARRCLPRTPWRRVHIAPREGGETRRRRMSEEAKGTPTRTRTRNHTPNSKKARVTCS